MRQLITLYVRFFTIVWISDFTWTALLAQGWDKRVTIQRDSIHSLVERLHIYSCVVPFQ